jgi:hypothetical protein
MKGAVAIVDHVVPPSVDRRTPAPSRAHQFPSPVPQYTVAGPVGSNAIAPVVRVEAKSVRGIHVAPRSFDSQIPPAAAPARMWLTFPGSIAIAAIRPETSTRLVPYVCPLGM